MKFFPLLAIISMALVTNSFAKQDEPVCEQATTNVIPFRPRSTPAEAPAVPTAPRHDNVEYLQFTLPAFTKVMITKRQREKGEMPKVDFQHYDVLQFYRSQEETAEEYSRYIVIPKNQPGQRTIYTSRLSFQQTLETADRGADDSIRMESLVRSLKFNLKMYPNMATSLAAMYFTTIPEEGSRVVHLANLAYHLMRENHIDLVIYDYDGEPMKWTPTPARR